MKFTLKRKTQAKIITTLIILVTSIIFILPFLWMISTSFKRADEIFSVIPKWLPAEFSFRNYFGVWSRPYFTKYLMNSAVVSLSTMIVALSVAVLAGYGISRFNFRGRTIFAIVLVAV